MDNQFMNVKESWFLYDTVVASPWVDSLSHPISGWFSDFNSMAQTDNISFFDSRNKSVGLAYNNQDSRDQIPYAFIIESISVAFFAPTIATQYGDIGEDEARGRVDTISPLWETELPQHTSAVLRVNQDERLKTTVAMLSPGYGPVGSAMGQGELANTVGGCNQAVACMGWGDAHLKYRWQFPTGIGVPRRATISVNLQFTEWAKDLLGTIWGPGYIRAYDWDDGAITPDYKPSMFMIQTLLQGRREVQQRGQYHA